MAANFDPYDKSSWFFGPITRQEATQILENESEVGVFLVRNSASCQGELVLCVKENNSKVSHYIINRVTTQGEETRFRIGEQFFPDIPSLLRFYTIYFLDSTALKRPAARKLERVRAKWPFPGNDEEDLPFKKGEILTVISKDEAAWWTAKNSLGLTGSIPVNYVEIIDENEVVENDLPNSRPQSSNGSIAAPPSRSSQLTVRQPSPAAEQPSKQYNTPNIQITRKLPARARVKQARFPNAYDDSDLKLQVGDIITVTETPPTGQWKGELNGKLGHFPFTHVEFIDSENGEDKAP